MAKKVIQVPVDAELLAALDQLSIPKSRLRQRITALPPREDDCRREGNYLCS